MIINEIIHEILLEIEHNPARFIIEVVQFFILAGAFWVLAIGLGKRRGIITGRLQKQGSDLEARLTWVDEAQPTYLQARAEAASTLWTARADARALVADAQCEADEVLTRAHDDSDREAERILTRADEVLAYEADAMRREVRDHLVDLVAEATRSVLSESLSLPEQRDLIETAVLASVESSGPPRPSQRRRGRTRAHA